MPLIIDSTGTDSLAVRPADHLTIGLVNNMPDAACAATERQFLRLIRSATPEVVVRVKLYSIPEVPRAEHMRGKLARRYCDVSEIWESRLDGLIVTGTEPQATDLSREPYWPALRKLVDWARENTASTIWSCLAAHAAVLHADGIERRRLPEKLFGVFDCEAVDAHPLTRGVSRVVVPHSRLNDLPAAALAAAGYRLLSRSATVGVDGFTREETDSSLFVFLQGHPEYEVDTLGREYRRDVGRFLRRELERYPAVPRNYFSDQAMTLVNAFRARAVSQRHERLIADFPTEVLASESASPWRRSAVAIYENWIRYLVDRKSARARAYRRGGAWRSGDAGSLAKIPSAG